MPTNETLNTILQRRSIRAYRPDQVNEEDLQAVVQAATYAPSAGEQPWHFTVVQNEELLRRMELLAKETARGSDLPWLKQLGEDAAFQPLYGAPSLIIVSCDESTPAPEIDAAAATQNLLLAAESLGLGSCWLYFPLLAFDGEKGDKLRDILQIPTGYKPCTSMVLGHREGERPEALPRKGELATFIR